MSDLDFWNIVDAVLVINLDERPDKWEDMRQNWLKIIPENKLHRISAVKGKDLPGYGMPPWFRKRTGERASVCAGQAGCVLSHKKAVAYARERSFRRILILEDDTHLAPDIPDDFFSKLAALVQEKLQGGILYFGCELNPDLAYMEMEENGRSVYRISGALRTHAFLVDEGAYDIFLKHYPDPPQAWSWIAYYKAVDLWLKTRFSRYGRIYAVYPDLVELPPSVSDIGQRQVHYEVNTGEPPRTINNHDIFLNKMRKRNDLGRIFFALDSWRRWLNCRWRGFPPYKKRKS